MERLNIETLKDGCKEKGIILLTGIEEKKTKIGNAYCVFTLSDGKRQIEAHYWNCSKNQLLVSECELIAIEVSCKLYNDALSYEVNKYWPLTEEEREGINIKEFLLAAPYNPVQMYDEIIRICKSVSEEENSLPALVENIYEANKDKLLKWSAAKMIHHNYYSGLLYHTFRMIRLATVIVRVYPSINAELLYSAVALHDIGKLRELNTNDIGTADYSVEGTLIGHSGIGLDIVTRAGEECGIDKEKLMCLKHCIASHHGKPEWGALAVPAMKEAQVLFLIDVIDSRVEQYEKAEETLGAGGLSEKISGLGAKVYKSPF